MLQSGSVQVICIIAAGMVVLNIHKDTAQETKGSLYRCLWDHDWPENTAKAGWNKLYVGDRPQHRDWARHPTKFL